MGRGLAILTRKEFIEQQKNFLDHPLPSGEVFSVASGKWKVGGIAATSSYHLRSLGRAYLTGYRNDQARLLKVRRIDEMVHGHQRVVDNLVMLRSSLYLEIRGRPYLVVVHDEGNWSLAQRDVTMQLLRNKEGVVDKILLAKDARIRWS